MINCEQLFKNSDLNLLVWARHDPSVHAGGMDLLDELLTDPSFCDSVMPMLRPGCRKETEWNDTDWIGTIFGDSYGGISQHAQRDRFPDGSVRIHLCELWIQAAPNVTAALWDRLEQWINDRNGDGRAWQHGRSDELRLWQPFGCCGQNKYVRDALIARCHAEKVVNMLTEAERAWLLKLIWYRASEEIVQFRKDHSGCPLATRQEVADLMGEILKNINLGSFGFQSYSGMLNPAQMEGSHMPAFAVNAVVDIPTRPQGQQPWYPIESFYKTPATHPFCYPSRSDYLDALR